MKILSFGDLHVYTTHQFSKINQNGYSTRLNEHIATAKLICKKIEEVHPDIVVLGGDVFHTQGTLDVWVIDAAYTILSMIRDACNEVGAGFHVLVGNHDLLADNNSVTHSLKAAKFYKDLVLHEKLEEFSNLVFLPYVQEAWKINQFLETIENKEEKVAFAHLDFFGAKFHDSLFDNSGIKPELFKDFKKVIGFHYHLPQSLGNNIVFPGSPQRWSFREPKNNITRGLILYYTEINTVERIALDVPDWIVLDDTNLDEINSLEDNNYIKLCLSSDYVLDSYNIKKVSLERFKGLEIQYDVERIGSVNYNSYTENNNDGIKSDEEFLKEYIEQQKCDEEEKKVLLDKGLDMLSKVKK